MNLRKDHSHEVPFTTVDWQRCLRLYDCPWRSLAPASYFCWHNGERQVRTVKTEPTSATVNALVRGSRKSTANCDKHCDVQHSESERNFERDSCIEESSLCIWIVVVYGIGSIPLSRGCLLNVPPHGEGAGGIDKHIATSIGRPLGLTVSRGVLTVLLL